MAPRPWDSRGERLPQEDPAQSETGRRTRGSVRFGRRAVIRGLAALGLALRTSSGPTPTLGTGRDGGKASLRQAAESHSALGLQGP